MEELVRQQRIHEVAEVAQGIRERQRRHDVVLRGAVFEPAAESDRAVNDVEEDRVDVVRSVARSHDPILHRRHFGHAVAKVARDGRRVIGRRPDGDTDPLAIRLERIEAVLADKRHRVRELVVLGGAVDAVRRTLECRRHLPARREPKPDFGGSRQLPFFEHEQVGAEELTEVFHGPCDGEIDRVGRVIEIHDDVVSLAGGDAPGVLIGAIPMQRLARRILRAEPMDVARVVLDLVVAGTPRWQ